jgi:hypothetical protein
MRNAMALPSMRASVLAPGSAAGRRASASSKSAPLAAVAACTGSFSLNSPDSGMQTSLHTSQSARRAMSTLAPSGAVVTVTGTGSSSRPSKP